MKIYRLKPLSVCETNSYIVASEENNCVLIDAPADPDYILGEIESHGLTLKKIFLTHGHFDHIGAVADLVDRTGCEVYIHIMDKPKLTDDAGMLANLFRIRGHRNYTGKVNVFTEDDILKLDELEFDVLDKHIAVHAKSGETSMMSSVLLGGHTKISFLPISITLPLMLSLTLPAWQEAIIFICNLTGSGLANTLILSNIRMFSSR
jgi:glyoxylase-like metal-dependent hydrolase (beta-lactamase superfamily II)